MISKKVALMRRRLAEHNSGKRIYRHGDPGNGLEVNKVNAADSVSAELYSNFDIARTPQIVKAVGGKIVRADIHSKSWKANANSPIVDYLSHKVKGR